MKKERNKEALESFERLLDIMDELREKCPWDRKQTFETLRHLTIEETYELADAIIENDTDEIKKEVGDLLLHIVFYEDIFFHILLVKLLFRTILYMPLYTLLLLYN